MEPGPGEGLPSVSGPPSPVMVLVLTTAALTAGPSSIRIVRCSPEQDPALDFARAFDRPVLLARACDPLVDLDPDLLLDLDHPTDPGAATDDYLSSLGDGWRGRRTPAHASWPTIHTPDLNRIVPGTAPRSRHT